MTARPRIAVIGGGYAGMAAAQAFCERGAHVAVFEAAKVLGGRARRIQYRDETLDNGQHILSGAYSTLLQLMQRAGGPATDLKRIPLTLSMPPAFRMRAPRWPAPLHLAAALLGARGLGWADRFAALGMMRALRASNYQVDPTQTVAAMLSAHRQTSALLRHVWQPLAVGALNTPIDSASAQVFAHVLRDALDAKRDASDLLLPCVDLSALYPERAAALVRERGGEVLTGCRVDALAPRAAAIDLRFDGQARTYDAVIVAVGPHQLASLEAPGCLDGAKAAEFAFEQIVTVYFKFAAAVRLPEPMLGQADGRVQWFFDRRDLLHPNARDGLIAGVISAAGSPSTTDAAAGEGTFETLAWRELSVHCPQAPEPEWTKTVTEKFATIACTPALHARRPACATSHPRVFLAGDYVHSPYPATLESAARSGVDAARAALASITPH
ncbi:MAG: FAD-dependent oxidoreductase [Betaproteobacteria bacterium]|nr:FAD-dependent oxidoreductase [Betaproteobacteria bacterium]